MTDPTRSIRTLLYFLGHMVYTGGSPEDRKTFFCDLYERGRTNDAKVDRWIRAKQGRVDLRTREGKRRLGVQS